MGVQGCTKRWAPGCVILGEKVAFCLPIAGRRMQLFHHIVTQSGAHILEILCIHLYISSVLSLEEETFSAAGYNLLSHDASVVDQVNIIQ